MYNGHQAPEGIFFLQEKESNSRQSVEALAVANGSVIPAKCHQYPPQLVNLGGRDLRDTRYVSHNTKEHTYMHEEKHASTTSA